MKKVFAIAIITMLCGSSYALDAGLNVSIDSMSTSAVGTTNVITQATDGYLKAVSISNPSNATVKVVITTSAETTLGVERTLLSVTNTASDIYYPVVEDVSYLGDGVSTYGSQALCRDTFVVVTGASDTPDCPLKVTLVTDWVQ